MKSQLLCHLVGDYLIQSDYMAQSKTTSHIPALAHAATYTLPFLALTRRWQPLAVIAGSHYVIDHWRLARHVAWAKNQLAPAAFRYPWEQGSKTGYKDSNPLGVHLMIVADNTMHGLINAWALDRWGK